MKAVSADLASRAELPAHIPKLAESLPKGTHPMTQFCTLILGLQVCQTACSTISMWAEPYLIMIVQLPL